MVLTLGNAHGFLGVFEEDFGIVRDASLLLCLCACAVDAGGGFGGVSAHEPEAHQHTVRFR